jgi:hypothetical protein
VVYPGVIVLGFVRVLLININISTVFYRSFISSCYIHFNLRQGALATGSLVGSLVSSSFGSLISSSLSSLVGSLVSSSVGSSSTSLLGSSSSSYRYSFTIVVLKSVGLLGSYTLYISLTIPSNLNRLVHLPLCLVLPSRYTSISKLRGRS